MDRAAMVILVIVLMPLINTSLINMSLYYKFMNIRVVCISFFIHKEWTINKIVHVFDMYGYFPHMIFLVFFLNNDAGSTQFDVMYFV